MLFSQISYGEEIAIGTKIGTFSEADQVIYVNGQRIQGYMVEGDLAICVENLKECGFMGKWDSKIRWCTFDYVGDEDKEVSNQLFKADIVGNSLYFTDIEVYIGGSKVRSYFTDGYSLVKISDLEGFAKTADGEFANIEMNEKTLNEEVEFENTPLEMLLRRRLNQPTGAIYKRSLASVESFTDLVYGTDLRYPKRDYSYGLEDLGEVESVKVIGDLKGLRELFIKTEAYDLTPLTKLKKLEALSIEARGIRNPDYFKFLKEVDGLKKLTLYMKSRDLLNPDLNTEYFKSLGDLEAFELIIECNHGGNYDEEILVSDLSFLSDFAKLTKLSISTERNGSGGNRFS